MTPRRLAAIDCGTNSTRLLVAEVDDKPRPAASAELRTLARRMQITRLGRGVDRTGHLADEALERTVAVLREYRELMDRFGVGADSVRISATSAARDADNSDRFMAEAAEIVGTRPDLLTGDEEGRLSYRGATAGLDPTLGPFLAFDLGGGSTEFAVGTEPSTCNGVISVDVGCVRITEKFLQHDPPRPEELSAAISVTEAYLDDVDRALANASQARTVIGLAGTVSTVAAVEIGLPEYDRSQIHHFELTRGAAEDVFRTLATEPRVARAHNPGLEPQRVDTIVGGCCVLVAIYRHFDLDAVLVSEADILDGLVLSQLDDRPASRSHRG